MLPKLLRDMEIPRFWVGGGAFPMLSLTLRFGSRGEILAVGACVGGLTELQRHTLEAALRSRMPVRLVIRHRAMELVYTDYQLVDSNVDGEVSCYTLAGGQYAFDGVQPRQS